MHTHFLYQFEINRLPNGHFFIQADGRLTYANDQRLLVTDDGPGTEWRIIRRDNHGPNVYT